MKKRVIVFASLLLTFGTIVPASAGAFDEYYDYQNPDGTYSYYFAQGLKVTLDEEWYRETFVKTGDQGATFYHKDSYDKYNEEGLTGGRLFTIGASVNTSFQNLPSFEYIGFDEEEYMNYYAELPTDYQAYADDPDVRAEYDRLWANVREVIGGIELDGAAGVSGNDDLFTRVSYENDFSFEIPSAWVAWELKDPDTLFVSSDGSDHAPCFFVQKADTGRNAGEYVVQLKNDFLDTYKDAAAGEPEIITYVPADTDRKLAGYRGVYSSIDDSRKYTVLEYVEYIGEDLYRYYCTYVSETKVEGEYEDETTYFEFLHAIDTMETDAQGR